MNPALSTLILISQLANAWTYATGEGWGDPDEMLCSKLWRMRDDPWWGWWRKFIDYWTPLGLWRGQFNTHCEACYHSERERLLQRIERR